MLSRLVNNKIVERKPSPRPTYIVWEVGLGLSWLFHLFNGYNCGFCALRPEFENHLISSA